MLILGVTFRLLVTPSTVYAEHGAGVLGPVTREEALEAQTKARAIDDQIARTVAGQTCAPVACSPGSECPAVRQSLSPTRYAIGTRSPTTVC